MTDVQRRERLQLEHDLADVREQAEQKPERPKPGAADAGRGVPVKEKPGLAWPPDKNAWQ